MNKTANIKIVKGTLPVLISAPHVYIHKRPNLAKTYKSEEPYTDLFIEEMCKNTGAWGIYITGDIEYDPNYHRVSDNPYKKIVREIVKDNKIVKFIDIHGLNQRYDYDLGIYYPSKFSKSIKLAKGIADTVGCKGVRGLNHCILRFEESDGETLGEYAASELRVPSVQLEIARYIREKENLRNSLIENLSEYIRM